jgi:hypothetical protein
MPAILVALGLAGVFAQEPAPRSESSQAGLSGAPGQRLTDVSPRGFDLRPFQLPSLGVRQNARAWGLTRLAGQEGAGGPRMGPPTRPACAIQVLTMGPSLDIGIVRTAPADVDSGIQRSSGCAE